MSPREFEVVALTFETGQVPEDHRLVLHLMKRTPALQLSVRNTRVPPTLYNEPSVPSVVFTQRPPQRVIKGFV